MATITASSPHMLPVSSSSDQTMTRPRSSQGLPKELQSLKLVQRPHRFSDLGLASPAFHSALPGPMSPGLRSPGPFSPPLSARSFGTFIDSEPSTPAWSPRPNFDWDSRSTLVLLKPNSPSMDPPSPLEPTWSMLDAKPKSISPKQPLSARKGGSLPKPLSPLSVRSTRSSSVRDGPKEVKIVQLSEKVEEIELEDESKEDKENEPEDEQNTDVSSLPLGRLASKVKTMKTMLSRKNGSQRKSKKNKEYFDVEYLHDKHWTEM